MLKKISVNSYKDFQDKMQEVCDALGDPDKEGFYSVVWGYFNTDNPLTESDLTFMEFPLTKMVQSDQKIGQYIEQQFKKKASVNIAHILHSIDISNGLDIYYEDGNLVLIKAPGKNVAWIFFPNKEMWNDIYNIYREDDFEPLIEWVIEIIRDFMKIPSTPAKQTTTTQKQPNQTIIDYIKYLR